MGLISFFKKKRTVPSLEEQRMAAKRSVDTFIHILYNSFDNNNISVNYKTTLFPIAGITYYCDKTDIGMIRGVTFIDKNNAKDKTAIGIMAIADNSGQKLLEYIPKDQKKEYREFAGDEDMIPFIGYISTFEKEDCSIGLLGRIKLFNGDDCKAMYDEMIADTELLSGAFKGYWGEQTLEQQGLKLDWVLNRHF